MRPETPCEGAAAAKAKRQKIGPRASSHRAASATARPHRAAAAAGPAAAIARPHRASSATARPHRAAAAAGPAAATARPHRAAARPAAAGAHFRGRTGCVAQALTTTTTPAAATATATAAAAAVSTRASLRSGSSRPLHAGSSITAVGEPGAVAGPDTLLGRSSSGNVDVSATGSWGAGRGQGVGPVAGPPPVPSADVAMGSEGIRTPSVPSVPPAASLVSLDNADAGMVV